MKTEVVTNKNMKRIALRGLLILTAAAMMACGQNLTPSQNLNVDEFFQQQGIVNGTAVEPSDVVAKSTAALYLKHPQDDRVMQFCTATLVGQRTLVTAGHCLLAVAQATGVPLETLLPFMRVGFGVKKVDLLVDLAVEFVEIKSFVVHGGFRLDALASADENSVLPDIAMIQLKTDAPKGYIVAELLRDPSQLTTGTDLILSGYGALGTVPPTPLSPPMTVPSSELRRIDVKVDKPEFNKTQFSYTLVDGRTACQGDSGGPAYLSSSSGNGLVLAGVTSFGDSACRLFGVYTSVSKLIEWLDPRLAAFENDTALPPEEVAPEPPKVAEPAPMPVPAAATPIPIEPGKPLPTFGE